MSPFRSAAAFLILAAACSEGGGADGDGGAERDASSAFDGSSTWSDGGQPDAALPPRELPDISDITVDCSEATLSDLVRAREIYDDYLGDQLPTSEADFGWHVDPDLVSPEIVETVTSYALPAGLNVDEYHQLFDFQSDRFQRTTEAANIDIYPGLSDDVRAPYESFNPRDYIPATATHYGRNDSTDVIATQFIFRVACHREAMESAFAFCPDCVDVFVPLSGNDIHQVFELRFVRVAGDQLEVSVPFKVVSVDASGHITTHVTSNEKRYLFANLGGEIGTLRAFWRAELSGRIAQNLGTYGGPTPVLIRRLSDL